MQSVQAKFDLFLQRSDLRASSIEIYSRAVNWFVKICGDDLSAIRYQQCDDFRSWLKKGRSYSSANSYLRGLKSFFSWLFRSGYIDENPLVQIKLFKAGRYQGQVYTPDEIARMLGVSDLRWRIIIMLGLCSMRRAEILNLCVSDIDYEHNLICIAPKKDTARTWEWDIKDHNKAFVGLPDSLCALMLKFQAESILPNQPYFILKPARYEYLIKLKNEGEITNSQRLCPWGNFNRDFRKLLKRAKVLPKRFHDLRATFATDRYREGYDIKKIQYLLRHSSIETTARYVKQMEVKQLVALSTRGFDKKYYVSNVS